MYILLTPPQKDVKIYGIEVFMEYTNYFSAEKVDNFFMLQTTLLKKGYHYRSYINNFHSVCKSTPKEAKVGEFICDVVAQNSSRCFCSTKINFRFMDFDFEIKTKKFTQLKSLIPFVDKDLNVFELQKQDIQEKLSNEWKRFVYNNIEDDKKQSYLNDLKNYLISNPKFATLQDLNDYLTEIEQDLPFGSIAYYKNNKQVFDDLFQNKIKDALNCKKSLKEYKKYFKELNCDINGNEFTFSLQEDLYKENLEKLQRIYILLNNFATPEIVQKFLNNIHNGYCESYIPSEVERGDKKKLLTNQQVDNIIKYYIKKADSFIALIQSPSEKLEKQVTKEVENYCDLQKRYKDYRPVLTQYNMLVRKWNNKINIFTLADVSKQKNTTLETRMVK